MGKRGPYGLEIMVRDRDHEHLLVTVGANGRNGSIRSFHFSNTSKPRSSQPSGNNLAQLRLEPKSKFIAST